MIDSRTLRVALMLLAIFCAGGFCGWWIGHSTVAPEVPLPRNDQRKPAVQKEMMVEQFTRELSLTPEQRTNVDQVLTEWMRERRRGDHEDVQNRYAIFRKYSPLVRTNLTAAQQKTYDSMVEQMERRWRRMLQNSAPR